MKSSPNSKIAFLALTYNNFAQEDLMSKFFSEKDSHLYNLYIHRKDHANIEFSKFAKNTLSLNETVPTGWGYYSLVEATLILMKEALKHDPLNLKFVLISDSHLPLYSMEDMHSRIFSSDFKDMAFWSFQSKIARHRFYKMFDYKKIKPKDLPICVSNAAYVSQWFICNREDAVAFVENASVYENIFDKQKMTFADESYFAVFANHLKLKWVNKQHCFADWDMKSNSTMISRGCKAQPHTFEAVSNGFIKEQREKGMLFIRKVHSSTVVDQNTLFAP